MSDAEKDAGFKPSSIADKIGALFSRLGASDIAEASIYAGLAYLGYDKLPSALTDPVRLLWGPVALKLATSMGSDTPAGFSIPGVAGLTLPVGPRTAGLIMLAALGFACMPWTPKITDVLYGGSDQMKSFIVRLENFKSNINALHNVPGLQTDYDILYQQTWDRMITGDGSIPPDGEARLTNLQTRADIYNAHNP